LRVALAQLSSGDSVELNLAQVGDAVRDAAARDAELVAFPEYALYRGPVAGHRAAATVIPGPATARLAEMARAARIGLLLGSLPERSADPDRPFNTSVLIGPDGAVLATYRKVHLFDVEIEDGPIDRESDRASPGDRAVIGQFGDVTVGLTICYDVRFPELYRALVLGGAQVIAVPATFTERTGRDHWEVLLRARAIENQVFVIAPAAWGTAGGITAYGRSLVIDPWGTVLAQAPDGPGLIVADLDLDRVGRVRRQVPALANRRPAAYREVEAPSGENYDSRGASAGRTMLNAAPRPASEGSSRTSPPMPRTSSRDT